MPIQNDSLSFASATACQCTGAGIVLKSKSSQEALTLELEADCRLVTGLRRKETPQSVWGQSLTLHVRSYS